MKTKSLVVLVTLACVSTLFLSWACVGRNVDEVALFKPAALAWPAVEEDFHRGLADGVEDLSLSPESADLLRKEGDTLEAALENRDRAELRLVPWPMMHDWAERGIADKLEDQQVGTLGAESLREQLSNFDTTMNRLRGAL